MNSITFPITLMDMKLKELCWKLDREVWAHVPGGGQTDEWSTSKAREESAKLITEYFGTVEEARHDEMNQWQKVVDEQRIELSNQFKHLQEKHDQIKEMKEALSGICNLCDNENPTHEMIWRVAKGALEPIIL
jgi:hypothetical protein